MDITQRGIITLMKSAVTEQALPLPEGFDLATAYSVFKPHHMSTLIYDGAVRCGISRSEPTMQKLFAQYCRMMLVSERQMAEVKRVFAAFEAAGIDYLPLKGCVMKARYPKPELRVMGDADVLIREAQYEQIVPVMEELGFVWKVGADHELVWRSEGLYLELHKYIVSYSARDMYDYFGDGWRLGTVQDGHRYSMSVEDEFIYLFTHFARHFRGGGIGCRHLVDLWVYRRSFPQMDEAYVRSELIKLNLYKFYDSVCRTIDLWFGEGGEDDVTELITAYIMSSGSFGQIQSHAQTVVARRTSGKGGALSNKLVYLREAMFPNAVMICDKYPILKRAPWLLPLVWLYRPIYKLLREPEDLRRHILGMQSVTKEAVDEKRAFFALIGIE